MNTNTTSKKQEKSYHERCDMNKLTYSELRKTTIGKMIGKYWDGHDTHCFIMSEKELAKVAKSAGVSTQHAKDTLREMNNKIPLDEFV